MHDIIKFMAQRNFDFYIVPTPIGNIKDITLRAIEVLKTVDLIACEDTRVTQKLLNHYEISTKCVSYHKYNEHERIDFFLNLIKEGKSVALVSDAGTPMICDPGGVIVTELLKEGFSVTSLAGACAVTTFLSQLPRKDEQFSFVGFIPRTEGQIKEVCQKYSAQNMVFYDSPERILKTLKVIKDFRGDIKISLGREITKLFEEIVTDKISGVLEHFKDGIKGEIVCMIYAEDGKSNFDLRAHILELKKKGFRDKEISVILSTIFKLNKNDVYKMVLEINN